MGEAHATGRRTAQSSFGFDNLVDELQEPRAPHGDLFHRVIERAEIVLRSSHLGGERTGMYAAVTVKGGITPGTASSEVWRGCKGALARLVCGRAAHR